MKSLCCVRSRTQPGFSLIEALVSLALVSFLILGTAHMLTTALQIRLRCDRMSKSSEAAAAFLSKMKSRPFESTTLEEGSGEEKFHNPKDPVSYILRWSVTDISDRMKQVEVTCFAEDLPRKRTHLILYISRDLGF